MSLPTPDRPAADRHRGPCPPRRPARALLAGLALLAGAAPAQEAPRAAAPAPLASVAAGALPAPIQAALARAQLPAEALHLWVAPAEGGEPWLVHRAERLAHPASVMKLLTSAAALELRGRSFQWRTAVLLDGVLRQGVLHGSLVLRGSGDPSLVAERLWLLVDRIRRAGVREIRGDIVLDRGAYALPELDPGAFDGEPLKPYNVRPDALLVNLKTVTLTLRPQPERGVAEVGTDLDLAGWSVTAEVPLADGPCEDWRAQLKADFSSAQRWTLRGSFPRACGERAWPVAHNEPARFAARAIEAMWRSQGGVLRGQVRDRGRDEPALVERAPLLEFASPPLALVLRDVNLYSNNPMAQQTLLALAPQVPATWDGARAELLGLLPRAGCGADELVLDNGSGLSRGERITARCLGAWLRWSWRQPWAGDLLASLPLAGEATARRATSVAGRAHLKTGSLADVAAIAGWIHAGDGRRAVVVAMLNHPQGNGEAGRALLDAVLRWSAEQLDTRR